MEILQVLTFLGNTGRETGFWLEEFAAPYFVFTDAGVELTKGSQRIRISIAIGCYGWETYRKLKLNFFPARKHSSG